MSGHPFVYSCGCGHMWKSAACVAKDCSHCGGGGISYLHEDQIPCEGPPSKARGEETQQNECSADLTRQKIQLDSLKSKYSTMENELLTAINRIEVLEEQLATVANEATDHLSRHDVMMLLLAALGKI